MSFLTELRRRNVFQVAIVYAITAWLIAQIAGLSAVTFFAPDWVMKMIITILLLGFLVAMVMAWAYEMTPVQDNPFLKAEIYAWRGENDSAFEALEAAFEQRDSRLANFLFHNSFIRLKADPRYPVFLEKPGLLEAWKAMPVEKSESSIPPT